MAAAPPSVTSQGEKTADGLVSGSGSALVLNG